MSVISDEEYEQRKRPAPKGCGGGVKRELDDLVREFIRGKEDDTPSPTDARFWTLALGSDQCAHFPQHVMTYVRSVQRPDQRLAASARRVMANKRPKINNAATVIECELAIQTAKEKMCELEKTLQLLLEEGKRIWADQKRKEDELVAFLEANDPHDIALTHSRIQSGLPVSEHDVQIYESFKTIRAACQGNGENAVVKEKIALVKIQIQKQASIISDSQRTIAEIPAVKRDEYIEMLFNTI